MGDQALPPGWRSDEDGNVYRLLTPSERAQIERTRSERPGGAEDAGAATHESGASAAPELAQAN
jgi:hypothetical protein